VDASGQDPGRAEKYGKHICIKTKKINKAMLLFSILSFACAKERTKEKHTGNDIQPLPDALIKL